MSSISLSNCFVEQNGDNKFKLFSSTRFRDLTGFHKYYRGDNKQNDALDNCYQSINSMVEFYSELYSEAVRLYHNRYCPSTKSEKKEIPISVSEFYSFFQNRSNSVDPPMSLIVEIADNEFNTIKKVGENLNRILRRERKRVSLDRAQQIDTQCVRWLSRQPGNSPIQKAGPKQQILAVVRNENFNTLENRVFKKYLKLCVNNSTAYIREYSKRFKNNKRLKSVERLKNLCEMILSLPEFETISSINSAVQPNFVLQNNPSYRRIWDYYQRLMDRESIMDALWLNRQVLFREFVFHIFISLMDNKREKEAEGRINNFFWLRKYPSKNGEFFDRSNEVYLGFFESYESSFSCKYVDTDIRCSFETEKRSAKAKIGCAYIPSDCYDELIIPEEEIKHRNIILSEKDIDIKNKGLKTILVILSNVSSSNENEQLSLPNLIFNKVKETI